jgi:hypothetical protein
MTMAKNQSAEVPAKLPVGSLPGVAAADLRENMEGLQPEFPVISILHGGAEKFEFPEEETRATFTGVILDHYKMKVYWENAPTEGETSPPVCFSMGGINGSLPTEVDEEGHKRYGSCAECHLNKFGTQRGGAGKGKACKDKHRLFVLLEGEQIPHRMTIPQSSIREFSNYMVFLMGKNYPYWTVATDFALKGFTSPSKMRYSVLSLKTARPMSAQEVEQMQELRTGFVKAMRVATLSSAESETPAAPAAAPEPASVIKEQFDV